MPSRFWLIDDTAIELVDRARLGVTLRVGKESQSIPPMTLGEWPVTIGAHNVALVAKRNLDVLRYQLTSDGYLVPRHDEPVTRKAPLSGTRCTKRDGDAVTTCPRCAVAWCAACAPDGNHCAPCLLALVAVERAAIQRRRRIGVALGLAIAIALLAAGVAMHSLRAVQFGAAALSFSVVMIVVSLLRERAERASGRPPASDTGSPS